MFLWTSAFTLLRLLATKEAEVGGAAGSKLTAGVPSWLLGQRCLQ
jgi:hypothetical protein